MCTLLLVVLFRPLSAQRSVWLHIPQESPEVFGFSLQVKKGKSLMVIDVILKKVADEGIQNCWTEKSNALS